MVASTERASLIVFSGELDKVIAAFVIATGAAASGMDVFLFFTFWGMSALRKTRVKPRKSFIHRALGYILPQGIEQLPLSRFDMAGAGRKMIRSAMKKNGVASLEELVALAGELGVRIQVCTMSMDLLGIQREELMDYPYLDFCGVASFVESASRSKLSLFI